MLGEAATLHCPSGLAINEMSVSKQEVICALSWANAPKLSSRHGTRGDPEWWGPRPADGQAKWVTTQQGEDPAQCTIQVK